MTPDSREFDLQGDLRVQRAFVGLPTRRCWVTLRPKPPRCSWKWALWRHVQWTATQGVCHGCHRKVPREPKIRCGRPGVASRERVGGGVGGKRRGQKQGGDTEADAGYALKSEAPIFSWASGPSWDSNRFCGLRSRWIKWFVHRNSTPLAATPCNTNTASRGTEGGGGDYCISNRHGHVSEGEGLHPPRGNTKHLSSCPGCWSERTRQR